MNSPGHWLLAASGHHWLPLLSHASTYFFHGTPPSELLYYWRFTANHFVFVAVPLRLTTSKFFLRQNTCGYSPYVTSSLMRRCVSRLQMLIPPQRSHSRVRVPRESWPHFTLSESKLPQPGGPGSSIYIPQEQDGPVIPPGTGFLFVASLCSFRADPREKTASNSSYIVAWVIFTVVAWVGYHGNAFAKPLPSNGRLFLSKYSGFQQTCRSI
jgi:hypothetical protein